MKKLFVITFCTLAIAVTIVSCGGSDKPGRSYMPDMSYSVAYETYAPSDERLKASGATYNHQPVKGSIARGDAFPYLLKHDSAGYAQSASVKNPLNVDSIDMKEAERLYLINCGICHGAKLDGDGPLFKGGEGPYTAKPATLVNDEKYEAMTEGTMFHSITYGKGQMGSYASQLNTTQRWEVVAYIKSKQGKKAAPAAATGAPVADTTAAK